MHLSISMVTSRSGEWDAGFDSIFREQRKRRATDSKREKTDKTDRDRHFCQGRMLSQNTSSIPTNSSACPRSRQQGKLGQLVTLRCQQILVPSLDFPRSMQGWDFLNFQSEFWGLFLQLPYSVPILSPVQGILFSPTEVSLVPKGRGGHCSHFMDLQATMWKSGGALVEAGMERGQALRGL